MMTNKTTPYADYNKWMKRLDTQLHILNNQKSVKVPKVIKPTSKKMLL